MPTPEPEPGPAPGPDEPEAASSEVPGHGEPRRYPSTIGGALYLLVLATTAAGIVVVSVGPWRTGLRVVAGALLGAALLRLALPSRDAGMLAVRNRPFDSILLAALGGALLFLSSSIPDQPV